MKNILCFGDSNTWGYNPVTKGRYPKGVRWTSLLQESLGAKNVTVIEEGLCGRTTVYEDRTRPNRRGIDAIPSAFSKNQAVDAVILMLGTNDCKSCYANSPKRIAQGVERCLKEILRFVAPEKVLLVSPIYLGEKVWMEEFDPEFDAASVTVSKNLKNEYRRVARTAQVHFLAASDYVSPSEADQEHLDREGHKRFAAVIRDEVEALVS